MRILLVEDSDTQANMIANWFPHHDVIIVGTAADAVMRVHEHFDLCLCDVYLPDAVADSDDPLNTVQILNSMLTCPVVAISTKFSSGVLPKDQTILTRLINERANQIRD